MIAGIAIENFKGTNLIKMPSVKHLKAGHPRELFRFESFLRTNPIKNVNRFNHYRPARYLNEKLGSLKKSIPSRTLGRFEQAFKRLNKLPQ